MGARASSVSVAGGAGWSASAGVATVASGGGVGRFLVDIARRYGKMR